MGVWVGTASFLILTSGMGELNDHLNVFNHGEEEPYIKRNLVIYGYPQRVASGVNHSTFTIITSPSFHF